jgi:hypothetical protein
VSEFYPEHDPISRLGELVLLLMKPGFDVYIDIALIDGREPEYDYTEVPHRTNMEDFRNGTD